MDETACLLYWTCTDDELEPATQEAPAPGRSHPRASALASAVLTELGREPEEVGTADFAPPSLIDWQPASVDPNKMLGLYRRLGIVF